VQILNRRSEASSQVLFNLDEGAGGLSSKTKPRGCRTTIIDGTALSTSNVLSLAIMTREARDFGRSKQIKHPMQLLGCAGRNSNKLSRRTRGNFELDSRSPHLHMGRCPSLINRPTTSSKVFMSFMSCPLLILSGNSKHPILLANID